MFEKIYEKINELLNLNNYDIRQNHNARFIDQKCTPDVVSFIADCIINLSVSNDDIFTYNDIFSSQYFVKHTQIIFNKPIPTNIHTRYIFSYSLGNRDSLGIIAERLAILGFYLRKIVKN